MRSKKSKKEPSILSEVRGFFGMTQGAFAEYLRVSRSNLSMAELGIRELPAEISNQVTQLHIAMLNAAENPDKVLKNKESEKKSRLIKAVEYRVSANKDKLKRTGKTLSKLQLEHNRATLLLATLGTLREDAKPHSLALYNMLADDAETSYDATAEDTRLNLELRIEAIKAENAFLEKKLKDLD